MCALAGGRAGGGRSKGEALAPPTDSIQFKNTAAPSPPDPHGPTIRSDTLVNTFSETKAPWNTVAAGKPSLEDMGAAEERPGGEPRPGRGGVLRAERKRESFAVFRVLQPSGQRSDLLPAPFPGVPCSFPGTKWFS